MVKHDYSAPKATALHGSIEGNETQASQKAPLTVGERLTCLEKALSSKSLQGTSNAQVWSLIALEKRIDSLEDSPVSKQRLLSRIDQSEKRIVKIEDDIMRLRPLSETPGVSEYHKIKEMEEKLNKQDQHFDRRCTEIEGRLSSEGAEPIIADISRRLRDIEAKFTPSIDQLSTLSKELMGPVQRELQAIKTALAAFSNHIHLPDGRLGMPFTLKG